MDGFLSLIFGVLSSITVIILYLWIFEEIFIQIFITCLVGLVILSLLMFSFLSNCLS
ncbi:hypothetical protein K435DRAFT_150313 [Dendrothele bispora CBS 962.96]|uniref:Uncharacterized protein n=1 Tax=Dendrothele bispora (strain CBS 962.96) TaxID=1314807 RepID=A0A4S8MRL1_DENBC|nr:hypothetical protein K435DRAFT_150313 [Dendrothele bispora CBS 962.96]